MDLQKEDLALSSAEPFATPVPSPKVEEGLAPPSPKVEEVEEETYNKCSGPDGKKYIISKQTNIVYNLDIYIAKEELVPVGKWVNNMVVFNNDDDSDSELEEE
jgi:hypothetical protein